MRFWSWTGLGGALIISLQVLQTGSATIGQLLATWSNTNSKQPPILGNTKIKQPAIKGPPVLVDYGFKGMTFDRTESSLYPTTPRADKDFEKWEEQEELKHAQKLLLEKIASANDTEMENMAKDIVLNLWKNKASEPALTHQDDELDDNLILTSVPESELLHQRQETDNEKIVSSFFGNQPRPPTREPIFPNLNSFPSFSETFALRDRIKQFFVPETSSSKLPASSNSSNSTMSIKNTPKNKNQSSSTHSPLRNIINSIRIPTMTPEGGAAFNAQMQKLRENWNQRDIIGAVNESLKIATPILTDRVPLASLIKGVYDLLRCNTGGSC